VCVLGLAMASLVAAAPEPAGANTYPQGLVVSADPVDFTPHVLNGNVNAITTVGNRVIVGGTFTQVKNAGSSTVLTRNYIFAFDRTTGAVDTGFVPTVDAPVEALEPAADGTSVYLGGGFSTVNGVANFGVAKLNAATGIKVAGFNATTAGKVRDIALSGSKLYLAGDIWSINGVPRTRLGAVDAITGAIDPTLTIGTTAPRVSVDWIAKIDVHPSGSQMVIMGNFLEVDGVDRKQIAVIDLTGPTATLANWSTEQFGAACSASFWTYMRDVEYSLDGAFFAIVTTGGPYTGTLCDTASRWESNATGSLLKETWADWSGGDTLTAVAISDVAVYIGGHQRWMNNHLGRDTAGVGAVSREGIAALDIGNGVPLAWNPGKDRGVAVWDLHLTDTGLYVGSDTDFAAGEYHAKLAQFPLAGGTPVPVATPATLPTTMFTGDTGTTLTARSFTGTTFGSETTVPGNLINWTAVGDAFYEAGHIFYTNGSALEKRTFDGTTMGPAVVLPSWATWSTTKAATWDNGRMYYADGATTLKYRYLSLESGLVGSQTFTLTDGIDWASVVAMDFVGGDLYYARSDGNLWVVDVVNGVPVNGTQTLISGPGTGDGRNWSRPAMFFLSTDTAPTVAVTDPANGAVVGGPAVTLAASASDDNGVTAVEFFAGATSVGVDTDGADGWSVIWDSTTGADGALTVTATATDTIGQTASEAVTVTVDNLGPSVAITAPAGGATVGGVVGVTAAASDAVGVAQVEFAADGVSIGIDTNGADGWAVSWDSATSPDGAVSLTATATDTAGRTATDTISVTVDNSGGGVVLLVVANPAALSTGDTAVRDRLVTLGFTVVVGDDGTATAADAVGAAFVLISSTVNATTLGGTFGAVAQPVWVAKPYSFDDMLMTGTVANVDYGTVSSATVVITDPSHPLAAGRSGTVTVTTSSRTMSFGVPGAGATVVATAAGVPTTFVYDAGDTLVGGSPAAGCRLTSSIFQSAPTDFTTDGWALFDAAATFAGADCLAPPPGPDDPPTVTLTAPTAGSTVAGVVTTTATAGDDLGVTQVEFFADGVSLGVDGNGADGWSVSWDTTGSADGSVVVAATATDTGGQTATDSHAVTVANAGAGVVVMVVSDAASPASQDVTVRDKLIGLGYTVTLVDDNGVTAAAATGASFVLVASSVNAGAVGSVFHDVTEPVWVAKPFLFDEMGLTGGANNADYGTVKATTITIVDAAHPLAGGYSGTVTVATSNKSISFGVPGVAADVVATVTGLPTIFVYEAGDTLFDGTTAAGCRLHFPIYQTSVDSYTTDAWALFAAAAGYAANGCG